MPLGGWFNVKSWNFLKKFLVATRIIDNAMTLKWELGIEPIPLREMGDIVTILNYPQV